jgi:hypothetical protein
LFPDINVVNTLVVSNDLEGLKAMSQQPFFFGFGYLLF